MVRSTLLAPLLLAVLVAPAFAKKDQPVSLPSTIEETDFLRWQVKTAQLTALRASLESAQLQMAELERQIPDAQKALDASADEIRKKYRISEKDSIDMKTRAITRR